MKKGWRASARAEFDHCVLFSGRMRSHFFLYQQLLAKDLHSKDFSSGFVVPFYNLSSNLAKLNAISPGDRQWTKSLDPAPF
jgi:hypothetical protein